MCRVIAVSNQKGGVGKTTTAVNLSSAFGAAGKRTLLVDTDPQGNSSSGVGIDRRKLSSSVYDVLIRDADIHEAIQTTEFNHLDLLPSSLDLAGAEIELAEKPHRESVLKRAIVQVKEKYDYILIDCPPSLGFITTNALNAADGVLIPIQCEFYALEGLSQLMNSVRRVKRQYNHALEIEGVLLTMYDGRLNLTQQVVDEVKKYFKNKVLATVIPRTVRLSEAPSFGQPIQYFDRNCKGSIAYNTLAAEILKKHER